MKFTPFYQFTVLKKTEKEVQKTKTIDDKEVKVLETEVTEEPATVFFKKPGSRDRSDADLFYTKKVNFFIKEGYLTNAMLFNKYQDTGGVVSEQATKELVKKVYKREELLESITKLKLAKKTAKNKEKLAALEEEFSLIEKSINDIEVYKNNLVSHTADSKARDELLRWFALNFSYIQKEGEDEPSQLFSGESYEERLGDYFDKEDSEDEFYKNVAEKIADVVYVWYFHSPKTSEDMEKLMKLLSDIKNQWLTMLL